MKLTLKHWLIAFLSAVFLAAAIWAIVPVIPASADTGNITCTTASGNYLNEDYLSVYKVPTNMLTYESAGGEASGKPISNAFDGNWNSFWQTGRENAGQGSANPSFLNAITVTFNRAVTIQSIVYASSSERLGHGYPTTLNIYTANGGALSLYGTCTSEATSDRVVFTLSEAVTVTQVKFEFRVVNTMHNWTATAKEIQFLQPDNPSANKVLDLFNDYAQLSVKSEYRTSLNAIRNDVSSLISYESALKPLLDRAEAIVNGSLQKDSRREFSTDKNAANVITQYGNLRNYASNTLKMSQFGINRQVLGIGGLTGQTITIYVEADAGDPLPSIAFNQVHGDWRSWQSTHSLSLGKNVFTFPNFITSNYSVTVTPGGAIHLINTYEPSQQSSHVKIYVEGGFLYPVFRKGGNVDSFRADLTSYYNQMQNTTGMCNITEIVGDHFLHTVSASVAYSDYITGTVNPQRNAELWDEYITALLEFDGVSMKESDAHFNEKNLHLYTNFRKDQPWAGAGAFSAGDHIGFITFGEGSMTNFSNPGWGVAHEIGHALDCNRREKSETTNNMWSKFALAYFSHDVSRNFNASMTNALTADETVTYRYFGTGENYYSYQIWWNLEACFHGFWGNLDNMYRYFDEAAARTEAGVTSEDGALTADERMVYFSSLVVGEDLGYYYERYGFSFSADTGNYSPFKVETASAAYKKLMAKALADGVITEKGYKYWYIDANQYFYDFDLSGKGFYSSSKKVEIREVMKTSSGYTLLLPEPADNSPHLGYEIMEYRDGNWYVIGFTYSGSFTDTKEYEDGYVPKYKIRAYDRGMRVSAESSVVTYKKTNQSKVCRIGEVYYNSIAEAVAAASANDTVYICTNLYDGAITINKTLTLLPDPSVKESVVITKSAGGAMFTVNSGVTFTIGDNEGARIILDGNSFSQNGALIRISGGTLRVYNAELRNNRNTEHGGAIYNEGNSAFTNVVMKDNLTSKNGGAIANFSGGIVTLTDCSLTGNVARGNGGALTLDGRTTLIRTAVTGNTAANVGGAMYIACTNNARSVSVESGEISGNSAGKGSAIYFESGVFTLGGSDLELRISGEIYRHNNSINISSATLDFTNATFRTPSVAAGAALLTATGNLAFTEDFVTSLKVELADAYLGNANKAVLLNPWSKVTFIVNGASIGQQVELGSFVLPDTVDGLSDRKFITVWECDGKLYYSGQTVEITGACSFTAVVGDKCTVTLEYDNKKTKTYYVKPNDNFVLQTCVAPEGKKFSHWEIDGVTYKAGKTVNIKDDVVIKAVFTDAGDEGGSNVVVAVVVVIVVLLVVGGATTAAVIFIKRKNAAKSAIE